jgi:hypothetical protein
VLSLFIHSFTRSFINSSEEEEEEEESAIIDNRQTQRRTDTADSEEEEICVDVGTGKERPADRLSSRRRAHQESADQHLITQSQRSTDDHKRDSAEEEEEFVFLSTSLVNKNIRN